MRPHGYTAGQPTRQASTVDQHWTWFVRGFGEVMRFWFMPMCSRGEPCCENECKDVATHFARTGKVP